MNNEKEVYFDIWCAKCKFAPDEETGDPCNDCLDYPYTLDGRPAYFKKDDKNKKGNNNE